MCYTDKASFFCKPTPFNSLRIGGKDAIVLFYIAVTYIGHTVISHRDHLSLDMGIPGDGRHPDAVPLQPADAVREAGHTLRHRIWEKSTLGNYLNHLEDSKQTLY